MKSYIISCLVVSTIFGILCLKIGYNDGYEAGIASGYLAGMNAKKPIPKVIVITPRCIDIPIIKADSLWRL